MPDPSTVQGAPLPSQVQGKLWRRADVALALLTALATLAVVLGLALSERGSEATLALVVTVCRRTLDEMVAHGGDLGRLSFLLPLGLGLVLAVGEALRLTLMTRRWMAPLAVTRCAPTPRLRRLAQKCGLTENVVLTCAGRPLVFTHGLFRPKVWLSTELLRVLTDEELEAVLRHEAHHLGAYDPLKILVVRCLSRALFFVPVARDLGGYCVAKEIAADDHAVHTMGDALPLARALRKLLAVHPAPLPEFTLIGQLSVTEARLLALLDPARPQPLFPLPRLGVSLTWLIVLLVIAFAPAAGHLPSFDECARRTMAGTALLLGW